MPLKTIVRRTARDELQSARRERTASVVQPLTVVQRGDSRVVPACIAHRQRMAGRISFNRKPKASAEA